MTPRTMKILAAAAVATALLGTATVARSLHQPAPAATSHAAASTDGSAPRDSGTRAGARHAPAAAPPQAALACGITLGTDCAKIETWLPE
jgi:hypothetical protein